MKILYIGGLEHSGTTLTEQLLSSHPFSVSLGEIASFFSPSRMHAYFREWGDCDDVRRCSCGRVWEHCEFWGPIIHLCGTRSNQPLVNKYVQLLDCIRSSYGDRILLTDSSKSIFALDSLRSALNQISSTENSLAIVGVVKDVRSFAASMMRKSGKAGALEAYRFMNYWKYSNKKWLNYLNAQPQLVSCIGLYEHLCLDPIGRVNRILNMVGEGPLAELDISNARSHIAMGNKNFLMRNRSRVRYDQTWFLDDKVLFAYLANRGANRLNRDFYAMSDGLKTVGHFDKS